MRRHLPPAPSQVHHTQAQCPLEGMATSPPFAGEKESSINAAAVAELLEAAGAAAVTIHGRTMEQR